MCDDLMYRKMIFPNGIFSNMFKYVTKWSARVAPSNSNVGGTVVVVVVVVVVIMILDIVRQKHHEKTEKCVKMGSSKYCLVKQGECL